ncbi:hypothetical protein [Sulfurisphaera tokodaii]|uniref:Uncharacterized protein n=2 Tax=Sulfurisphaera tokodaii TaxID=111955 RepID=Q975V8_SULTO|nr:hypothetical protein [Sulfurisphaera tokodaii]BAB65290.1 hypothetical protein STK_03150 [Sulfurisphaera tokodaii str. 7]HII75012.1 hypothetical protein [Sulfurisphaera tokodaii]
MSETAKDKKDNIKEILIKRKEVSKEELMNLLKVSPRRVEQLIKELNEEFMEEGFRIKGIGKSPRKYVLERIEYDEFTLTPDIASLLLRFSNLDTSCRLVQRFKKILPRALELLKESKWRLLYYTALAGIKSGSMTIIPEDRKVELNDEDIKFLKQYISRENYNLFINFVFYNSELLKQFFSKLKWSDVEKNPVLLTIVQFVQNKGLHREIICNVDPEFIVFWGHGMEEQLLSECLPSKQVEVLAKLDEVRKRVLEVRNKVSDLLDPIQTDKGVLS